MEVNKGNPEILPEKVRICLVIPSLQAGGMERVMTELAWHFSSRQDIELHLVLYGISRQVFYKIPDQVIIHKPDFRFNDRFRLYNSFKTLVFLRRTIDRINPESILSFGEYWNIFVLIALYGLRYPVYISDRCQPDKKFGKFHHFLRKIMYPRAAGIIAQSKIAKEIYSALFRHKNIAVIGNPIRSINVNGSDPRENIVLSVGRLISTKHHDRLIEVFLQISKPGWKLLIVGYDHLKQNNSEKLRRIISENHAEEKVMITGKLENVEEYYIRSRIFAFTSSSEGFPNVIGEAMSAGMPVIAFDCVAGPAEMIKDGHSGFLIPLFDYKEFQEKLKFLMINDELREKMGRNAKDDIKEFSVSRIGEQYLQFILGHTI